MLFQASMERLTFGVQLNANEERAKFIVETDKVSFLLGTNQITALEISSHPKNLSRILRDFEGQRNLRQDRKPNYKLSEYTKTQ